MDYDTLMEWVTVRPFDPFKLVTTDGAEFAIPHPSLVWPGSRTVLVGLPDNPQRPDVPGKHVTLAMSHIVRCEPLSRVAGT